MVDLESVPCRSPGSAFQLLDLVKVAPELIQQLRAILIYDCKHVLVPERAYLCLISRRNHIQ